MRLWVLLLLPPPLRCVYDVQLYPLKRIATPEDVAWAVCWLTHPKTTFTTGVVSSDSGSPARLLLGPGWAQ